jgi:hypothetical protein
LSQTLGPEHSTAAKNIPDWGSANRRTREKFLRAEFSETRILGSRTVRNQRVSDPSLPFFEVSRGFPAKQ